MRWAEHIARMKHSYDMSWHVKRKGQKGAVCRMTGNGRVTTGTLTSKMSADSNGEIHAPLVLVPAKHASDIHWTEGWMCVRANLDGVQKRTISVPPWRQNWLAGRSTIPIRQPSHYTDEIYELWLRGEDNNKMDVNPLTPNDLYKRRTAQTLHFKYLFNKYAFWIF